MMRDDGVHPLVNTGMKPYKHISFSLQPNDLDFVVKMGSSQVEATLEKEALLF